MKYTKHINPFVNPTIDDDAYTANDVVGGLLEFDVSKLTANGGLINQALFVDEDALGGTWTLYLFGEAPTTIADDAAFAPTVADLNKLCAVVAFGSATTVNSLNYTFEKDMNDIFTTSNGILYGYLVCGGTPNPTTTDGITITLWILGE